MSEQGIMSFLAQNGPSTPAQLAKHIGTTLLFASAMLGEVSSKKLVKVSNLKIGGGSPLYYLKEHGEQLQNFSDKLNSKDKEAYEIIKTKKVVRDKEQPTIVRVALRAIKDFAVPLTIVQGNEKELFWKWYMMSDTEAEPFIRKILGGGKNSPKENQKEVKEKIPITPKASIRDNKEKKIVKKEEKKPEVRKEEVEIIKQEPKKTSPIPKKEPINTAVRDSHINEFGGDLNSEFETICKNAFGKKITNYFNSKKIKILNYDQLKKNKEFSFVLRVPSAIGTSKFFSKAVDKKKIGEGDLALALVEGQHKQLPVLFITTGDLNKKTEEKINILFKDLNYIKV